MSHGCFNRLADFALIVVAHCLGIAFWPGASPVNAQQLSIRHYDVSDGLAHSHVSSIYQDAKGYLWFATWEGLSRFDGYRFKNYSESDGLGDPIINDIAEDKHGHLWVATNGGGVARLNDDGQSSDTDRANPSPKFNRYLLNNSAPSNRVNALSFDSQNNIWCATDGGLYRGEMDGSYNLNFQLVVPYEGETSMVALADRHGRLWFGMENELIEIINDQIIKYGSNDEFGGHKIVSIIEDWHGNLMVANEVGVFEMADQGANRSQWRRLPLALKPVQSINALLSDQAGTLWIGTGDGLIKFRDGKQTLYTSKQGLSDNAVSSVLEDRDGNLWIGSAGGGVCKLSSELIVSYTRAEGLPNQDVRKVIEDPQGRIFASIENGGIVQIIEGSVVPISESLRPPFTNFNERIVQDLRGDWWIGTDVGLFRFKGPAIQFRQGQTFTEKGGISEVPIGGLYADASGKVWFSPQDRGLYFSDPSASGPVVFRRLVPPSSTTLFRGAQQAISDPSGTLWLAGHEWLGKLINEEVVMLQPTDGLPETRPRAFFVDSRGWLWVGLRYKGVSVTKNPASASPDFTNYSTANGLKSNAVWTIAEDDAGRMYFGTGKGLDQLDVGTGHLRHFSTDDGLASDIVNYCLKDRAGNIWIGTTLGVSKFDPHAERTPNPEAPIYLSRVQIAGEDLALPETGTRAIAQVELSAARNNLTIEYVALSFRGENELRYQYKLDGVDTEWSAPTDSRSINYAHLAPGSYQFTVRSVNTEGLAALEPASFQFRILAPIWQRWWFIALAVIIAGLAIYALYRYRVAQLLNLERVRTRIASDLHDDIGANLSLIAMLSEVARRQLPPKDRQLKEWFETIAATSRDTVDSMSDIVWAINPKRDHLSDLTRRMRRFADDIFAAQNVDFRFDAPELDRNVKLGADVRREVFLIFKETINNAVRHSGCSSVDVDLTVGGGWLELKVRDDGRGLDGTEATQGTGLTSMEARAYKLGGSFDVVSNNGDGTSVTLRVPV
jgi:ligand-binding sensor domain-containing protein/signal transduction histidine kinase